MKNAILKRKSIWMGIVLLLVLSVGVASFIWQTANQANEVPSKLSTSNSQTNLGSQKNEAKNFRQALSDLAWGRNRKEGPAIKPEAKPAQNLPAADSLEAQQQAMLTLQSRMAYCAQNWQKDPSCGSQGQPKKQNQ